MYKKQKRENNKGGAALLIDESIEQEDIAIPFQEEEVFAVRIKVSGNDIYIVSLYNTQINT